MNLLLAAFVVGSLIATEQTTPCPLQGAWKSDRELTMAFIEGRVRMERKTVDFLTEITRHLVVTYGNGQSTFRMPDLRLTRQGEEEVFEGFTEETPYQLLYCSEKVAVTSGKEPVTGNPVVSTYNFPEPGIMWAYVGNEDSAFSNLHVAEYFRKVAGE